MSVSVLNVTWQLSSKMMSKCFSGGSDYVYLRHEVGIKEKKNNRFFLLDLHMLQLPLIHECAVWQSENLSQNAKDIKISESQTGVHCAEDVALLVERKWEPRWMVVRDNICNEFHWLSRQVLSNICTLLWDILNYRSLKPPHVQWHLECKPRWDLFFYFRKTNWSQSEREEQREIVHSESIMKAFTLHRTGNLVTLGKGFCFQQQKEIMTPMTVYDLPKHLH